MTRQTTAISRRIQQSVEHIVTNDWEGALVNLFPAIDKTAKSRRNINKVGLRIKSFLDDEEDLISFVATGNIFKNISVDGTSITDALYKFGRTSISHEGEIDPRLSFNETGSMIIRSDHWDLPSGYIIGMAVAVITADENRNELLKKQLSLNVHGNHMDVNELWGQKAKIMSLFDHASVHS